LIFNDIAIFDMIKKFHYLELHLKSGRF